MHDRIRFERHRTVPGDAARGQLDGAGDLLERLDRRELDLAVGARDVPALRKAILGVNLRKILTDDELDADAGAAFLTRFGEEDDVTVERDVLPLEHQHDHQTGDEIVFVVHRPTAVSSRHRGSR